MLACHFASARASRPSSSEGALAGSCEATVLTGPNPMSTQRAKRACFIHSPVHVVGRADAPDGLTIAVAAAGRRHSRVTRRHGTDVCDRAVASEAMTR